jgi:uncharacterized membrane protein YphA (DoxX/SURF4 family)
MPASIPRVTQLRNPANPHPSCTSVHPNALKGTNMNIAFLIGRIIFSAFWLMSASDHFTKLDDMSQYAKAKGVPFPKVAVAGTGVLELLGGASMLLGVYPAVGIILLIVFMLGATFQMHTFWTVTDPQHEASRPDPLPEKRGNHWSLADALGHAATVAV